MSDLRARVDALPVHKRALLSRRLDEAFASPQRTGSSGSARLVAYVSLSGPDDVSVEDLRRHLGERLPAHMVPARFVLLDELPLTTAGKVDRRALPEPARDESPAAAPGSETERTLAGIWAEVLGFDEVGVHDDFFEMGGDSLISIRIIARAHKAGLRITPSQFFENPTVAGMAAIATAASRPEEVASAGDGPVPLTPVQHWFFDLELPEPQHWNQAVLLAVPPAITPAIAEHALQHLVDHHDALRLRFRRGPSGWEQQLVAAAGEFRLDRGVTPDELQSGFDLAAGGLMRAALLPEGLLLVLHHLVTDAVSLTVLLEDFHTACEALLGSREVELPHSVPFATWARALRDHAQSDAVPREAPSWLALESARDLQLPLDFEGGVNDVASGESILAVLPMDETRALLRDVPGAYRTRVNEALLAALVRAFATWTRQPRLLLELEGHARAALLEELDVTRTVGWLTTVHPLVLEAHADPGEALRSAKERLRSVPSHGAGWGLLRYLHDDPSLRARIEALPCAGVLFNYLGRTDADAARTYPRVDAPTGAARSRFGDRAHPIEINAAVVDGALRTTWAFSTNLHRRETIESLAARFHDEIRALVAHCASVERGGHTPSDFPLAGIDQAQLDTIAGLLDDED